MQCCCAYDTNFFPRSCTEKRRFCDEMPCYHGRCTPTPVLKESDKGYRCDCSQNDGIPYTLQMDCKEHPNVDQKEIKGIMRNGQPSRHKKWRWYGVVKKKVNHKREEKMHSKVKMTSQRAENLVHVQQHHGKHFYKKIFF